MRAFLKAQGYEAAEVARLIGSLSIEPVFAPHSTEAGRRTLLRKQQRIAQRLLERLDPSESTNAELTSTAAITVNPNDHR